MDLFTAIDSIRRTDYFNVHDKDRKTIKVLGLGFNSGKIPVANCKDENGKLINLPIIHLKPKNEH